MRIIIITILVFLSQTLKAEEFDYNVYHAYINKAETHFYINDNVDSCIYYYEKAFDNFEFIFVKDLVNVAQIAYFKNKPFKKYIIKGFEYGLRIDHLKTIPLFEKVYNTLKEDTILQNKYKGARKRYIQTINYNYLYKMYKFALLDQISKNLDIKDTDENYLLKLKTYISKYGFPGTKNLGVSYSNTFEEIGSPHLDIKNLKKKYNGKVDYYQIDDESLATSFALIILIHIESAYKELADIFKVAVKNGEIHPREVGMIYDNTFRYKNRYYNTREGVFLLNFFCDYKKLKYTEKQVKNLREKWNIVSVEVDEVKKEYVLKHGFTLSWGVFGEQCFEYHR